VAGSVEDKLARFVAELRRRGYRVTAQRLAIARIVLSNIKRHPSFMEILEKVKEEVPSVSPSTVFTNLQLMEQMGLVRSFNVRGKTHYDDAVPHFNVYCLDTGEVIDVEDLEALEAVRKSLLKAAKVEPYNIVVYGRCGGASGPG
jgi:Fur family peroxide stress response transcriptional regulator